MADEQPDVAGPSPLISLAEAARLTGRHPEALRALVRRGRLTAQRGNNGRLLLRVADLPVTLPADLPNPAAAEHQAAERPATAGHVADLEILVGDLRDELLEAHLRIGRLEAERDAATGLSEARMDAVRAQVVAKEERIVELKALLADARRPWWRKLVGALLLAGSLSVVGTPALAQSNGMELLAPAVAEPRMCSFIAGDEELDALPARCHAGDVLVGVVEERIGSLLSYAARLCDFTQQIVTYRHPDPSRTQNVFACVFTGRVLDLAEG